MIYCFCWCKVTTNYEDCKKSFPIPKGSFPTTLGEMRKLCCFSLVFCLKTFTFAEELHDSKENMKKSHLLSFVLALLSLPAMAQQVSVDEALLAAKHFLASDSQSGKRKANAAGKLSLAYTASNGNKNNFYIFNENDADGGFVIVSGDQRTEAILGYTESGNFDEQQMPENLRAWLNDYALQIKALGGISDEVALASAKKAPSSKPIIYPMVQTKWNQNAPYNGQSFKVNGEPTATGCVATAMAQIMSLWRYPLTTLPPIAGYTYTKTINNVEGTYTVPAISSHSINWSAMKNSYSSSETNDNIAWLMRHCGQAVEMAYGNSSSAATQDCPAAFRMFGYDKWVRYVKRYAYSIDEWEDLIYKEISEKRAVLLGGQSNDGGHAFVCDGYDGNGYFHINWGWGGKSNGYFLLSLLDPDSQGIGGGDGAYTMDHDAVIGISHGQFSGESPVEEPYLVSPTYSLSGTTLTYTVWNYSGVEGTFYYGVGYLQSDGTFQMIGNPSTSHSSLKIGHGYKDKTYTVEASQFPGNGTYKIMPISRLKDEDDKSSYHSAWPTGRYLKVVISGGRVASCSLAPEEKLSATWEGFEGPRIAGFDHKVKFNVTNNSTEEYVGDVYLIMRTPEGKLYRMSKAQTGIYLRGGESVSVEKEAYISDTYGAGTFTFYLSKSDSSIGTEYLLAQGTIELSTPPSADFTYVVMPQKVTFKGGLPLKAIVTIANGSSAPYPYPIKILIFKGDIVVSGSATGTSTHEYYAYLDTPIAVGETRVIEIPIDDFAEDGIYSAKTYIYRTPTSTVSYSAGECSYWQNFCAVPVDYTGWTTYASPYKLDYRNVDSSVKFYSGTVKGNELKLTEASGIYAAGTGFVVSGIPGAVYALPVSTASNSKLTQDLVGLTEDATFAPRSIYVLGKNSSGGLGFYPYDGTTMEAKHAYIPTSKVPASAQSLKIVVDGINAIQTVQNDENARTQNNYNLAGQKVDTGYKGIVIRNGKKVLTTK